MYLIIFYFVPFNSWILVKKPFPGIRYQYVGLSKCVSMFSDLKCIPSNLTILVLQSFIVLILWNFMNYNCWLLKRTHQEILTQYLTLQFPRILLLIAHIASHLVLTQHYLVSKAIKRLHRHTNAPTLQTPLVMPINKQRFKNCKDLQNKMQQFIYIIS